MEKSCDSFWKWANARKKMAYTNDKCLEGGSCSMSDRTSSVTNGLSFKILKEEGPLNKRQCTDDVLGAGSHMISEVNASKLGGPWSGLGTPVGSLNMEANLSNSMFKNNMVNCKTSPTSVIGALNVSSSLRTSSTASDIISCHPHGDLNPQSFPCADDELLKDKDSNDKRKPSELRVRGLGQKAGRGEGIQEGESSTEDIMYCSISEEAEEVTQLQQWCINEETPNSKPMCASVTISNDMGSSCEKRKSRHNLITNGSVKVEKENPESFAALNMLADVAVWVLENGFKEEDNKAMASPGQWQIVRPSRASSSHKIVIKRAKNDSKFLSPELHAHAHKLFPSLSEHHLASKLDSPRNSLNRQDSQEHGLADKDKPENPTVRSSKRNRSQYLSSKYADSVLEPLKRGTKRYADCVLEPLKRGTKR